MGLIRFLLAVAVLNSHFPFVELSIVDGHEAVLTFFAISGFYMALILDTRGENRKRFYMGRFLSLYPMYVFALMLSIGLVAFFDIHPMSSRAEILMLLSDPAAFLLMVWTSICVVGQELHFCLAQSQNGGLHFVDLSRYALWRNAPIIQTWSLSLEVVFYIMAPLLLKLRSSRLLILITISLFLKILVVTSPLKETAFFLRFFPLEFWLFGSGIISYRLYTKLPKTTSSLDIVAFCCLFCAICIADLVPDQGEPFVLPLATLVSMPFIFRSFGQFEFDKIIGKITYPFYLLHFSIIAIFEQYYDEPIGWHILLVTLMVAIGTHLLFTPVIDSLKRRMRNAPPGRLSPSIRS